MTNREVGGALSAVSAGQTPRNRKQACNMKQYKPVGSVSLRNELTDVLGSLLVMANDGKQGSTRTHPNPLFLVLSTATQFQNLETYCIHVFCYDNWSYI